MTIDQATIIAALKMPPEQAVEFLRGKGLQVSEGWRDLWQTAHRRAFTVAQSAGYDVLENIRQALLDSMAQGESYQQFTDKLKPTLQAKGWWGKAIDPATGEIIKTYPGTSKPVQLGSPRRLKLIYEQNLQTAFMAGRWRTMKDATATHPYWQYVAILYNRTRPTHRAMDGRVFSHDDPAWSVAYPPNGWRCRCRARPISNATVKREDLTVGTAEGYVQEVEVPQRDGSMIKVKRLNLPGMDKPFQPDAGWDYNPAADYHQAKP
jgi:SPP1 gp7 family putative phage head morphogenesis protein